MKAGIITFHFPYNCGAVLQCVALQTVLEDFDCEVQVINYRPWYHQNRYIPRKNPVYYGLKCTAPKYEGDMMLKRIYRGARGFAGTVRSWKNYKTVLPKHEKFEGFIKKTLHETKVYRTVKKLQKDAPDCDLYISGSDQLWNAKITEGVIDPAYLMDFGKDSAGRITYAVGVDFSALTYPKEDLKPYLKKLDAISMREKECYGQIEELVGEDVYLHVDVDPTLLLDASEYEKHICKEVLEKEPFILTYTMPNETQAKVYNAAKILGEKLGIKVIDVCGDPKTANKKVEDNRICGPDEFLWYMKNASYVITNSFHGTAFSVIFRKQFVSIPHTMTGYRVREVLEKVGLGNQWVNTGLEAVDKIQEEIDFTETERKIKELQADSKAYLKMCIDKYGNK